MIRRRIARKPKGPRRRLVRAARKGFLTADGTWTRDIAAAHDFTNMSAAVSAMLQRNLTKAELHYSYADDAKSPFDFALEV